MKECRLCCAICCTYRSLKSKAQLRSSSACWGGARVQRWLPVGRCLSLSLFVILTVFLSSCLPFSSIGGTTSHICAEPHAAPSWSFCAAMQHLAQGQLSSQMYIDVRLWAGSDSRMLPNHHTDRIWRSHAWAFGLRSSNLFYQVFELL